ncbi:hypothetical protein [Oscillatoria salina]|uniref:hypothetical protein n=1 Tax=Oscillatoria salina TaxID=331517 RepID=UPI001CCEB586|nr:hypothetical protein [Oscillatoria salina]MBZ8181911.1 hypothetical protein [Oscillatoria salina IIICB1]
MRKLFIYVLTVFASVFSVQQAKSLPLPNINKSEPYRDLRSELIDLGWQPLTFPPGNEFDSVRNDIMRLEGWREVEACSGTGLGFCLFVFDDGEGNRLSITTVNNSSGFPVSKRHLIWGWRYEPVN